MKRTISMVAGVLALVMMAQAAQAQARVVVRKSFSPFYHTVDPYTGDRLAIYRPNYLVPSNDFEGGAYPGLYAVKRAQGQCVIDLGYGRFEYC
jgi:hypothetical protein